jgi:hypothetical protein
MIFEGARLDPGQYSVQYELLRSQVIGAAGDVARGDTADQTRGIGLALLLSEGLPGWLKSVEAALRSSLAPRAVDSPDASPHESSAGYSAAPVSLSSAQRHEVTALLASLVLSTRPGARSSSREGYRSW